MRRSRKIALALVVLLAVVLAFNTIAVNGETQAAEAESGARILELAGGDLQIREDGDPKDPPLVLLHGYTASMRWWDAVAERLDDRFYVIRLDLLGHGGSEKPGQGYAVEDHARQVALALGQLNVEGATVAGHSLGGMVAVQLAAANSELVDRAVLIDTSPLPKYRDESLAQKISRWPVIGQAAHRLAPDAVIRNGLGDAFAPDFEVPDRFVQDFKKLTHSSYKQSHEGLDRFQKAKPVNVRATEAAIPLLVIFGREDSLIDPAAANDYREVPGARIVVMPDTGHSPQVEQPDETASLIEEFAGDEGD